MEYLQSNKAVRDYVDILQQANYDNELVQSLWADKLTENGITQDVNENDILPEKIVGKIQANVRDSVVLSKFNLTFNIEAGQLVIDKSVDTAKGHKKLANKSVQTGALVKRTILPEAIYKLQQLDHMTFLKGGALVTWVLEELPKHVVRVLEQAILVGGVKNTDDTPFTAVYPILTDELATQVAADSIFNGIIDGVSAVDGDSSNRYIFINPSDYATLLKAGDALSVAILTGNVNLGATIVPTDIVAKADNPKFMVVNTDNYLVGFAGSGVETLSAFAIMNNAQVVESRAYVAGSLTKQGGASIVTVTLPTTPAE